MEEKGNRTALPDILVVGIAGGSGGGKTTLTNNLVRRFGEKVCIVHHDNYYRAHDDLTTRSAPDSTMTAPRRSKRK